MNIENKIIEELRKSAKIGEVQGETLRLDRAEQIIHRYLNGESFGERSCRKWYQKGLEEGRHILTMTAGSRWKSGCRKMVKAFCVVVMMKE